MVHHDCVGDRQVGLPPNLLLGHFDHQAHSGRFPSPYLLSSRTIFDYIYVNLIWAASIKNMRTPTEELTDV